MDIDKLLETLNKILDEGLYKTSLSFKDFYNTTLRKMKQSERI